MHSFLHALNIGTLATWLSVTGAGSIALVVKSREEGLDMMEAARVEAAQGPEVDLALEQPAAGSAAPSDPAPPNLEPLASPERAILPELMEAVPELPELAQDQPLPEIPQLPEPAKPDPPNEPQSSPSPKPASPARQTPRGSDRPSAANSGSGSGRGSGTSSGSGSGSVGAARWAGGRMPAPNYPAEARRKGEQGRVVVLFSVDEQGNVVSASVTGPCPYPALNEEALRAVRRWKFQPGPRASLQRPIVFKLN